ncbi:AAA family ATPase [Agrobacterium salinitolerans]|nr:AAA family ATPase [Agrobacterium salinitolerans]
MISSELEQYISAASSYARSYLGAPTSLVHILLAVLDDPEFQLVLNSCGVDYLDLRQEAVEAIAERMAVAKPSPSDRTAGESRGDNLSALCLYAIQAAQQKAAARGSLTAGVLDFIAAVLEIHDNGSFDFQARIVLSKAGLTVGTFAKARKVAQDGSGTVRTPSEQTGRIAENLAHARTASVRMEPLFADHSPPKDIASGASFPFCTDITDLARQGKLDRSHGRTDVLDELRIVLGRRKKRNAILIGDPGVGKTSVVEELAYLIIEGKAGPKLEDAVILSLNMGALVGGTKYRGELEERVKDLVAVLSNDPRLILFIDEIHVLGSPTHSASAAADILKPALASGAIRCVGATTLAEYKKFFESDGAMSRRFAPVNVVEPTRGEALDILRAAAAVYAEFHGVEYPDWAIEMTLDLSIRHMPERRLPDKAIELLDDVGARTALTGARAVTRETVADCVSAKTGRRIGRAAVLAAIASISTDAAEIAKAAMRNAMVAPDQGESAVIAIVGPKEIDKEAPVKSAATALGRGYEMLDMADFADQASAAGLLGAPPGYVGHDSGGRLYDIARRSPGGLLHLRNVSQAHPTALAILEECRARGFVRDRTGRIAGLGGIQIVVSMDTGTEKASIGFSSTKEDFETYDVGIVDDAETVIVLRGASDEALDRTRSGLAILVASAAAAGAQMTVGEGVEEHVASLLKSSNSRSRDFARLVRVPVLDYLVSGSEDFTVESVDGGIRIRRHEAV